MNMRLFFHFPFFFLKAVSIVLKEKKKSFKKKHEAKHVTCDSFFQFPFFFPEGSGVGPSRRQLAGVFFTISPVPTQSRKVQIASGGETGQKMEKKDPGSWKKRRTCNREKKENITMV